MTLFIQKRTLYTHILKELLSPFFLGLLIFTFILLMNKMLKLMDLVVNKGISPGEIIRLIVFLLPSFLVLTIPMSILLAILITLGRLAADGELLAFKASGISLYQILAPFALLCCIGFFLTNSLTLVLLPSGNRAFRSHLFDLSRRHSEANLQERIFNDDFAGLVIYINAIPGEGQPMKGILISDKRDTEVPSLIIGEEGVIISDPQEMKVTLRLFNGSIHRAAKNFKSYQKARFDIYDMNLQLSEDDDAVDNEVKYSELDLATLMRLAAERKKENRSAVKILTELHKRLAFPCACFMLGLIGIPLGAYRQKGSRSYGFVLCMTVLFLYYFFLNLGESMAKRGILYPALGIWLPNMVLGIMGCYFLRVVGREKPLRFLNGIERTVNFSISIVQKLFKRS